MKCRLWSITGLLLVCFVLLIAGIVVPGCSVLSPGQAYVQEDKNTLQATRVYLSEYVHDHPARKPVVEDMLTGWLSRITAADRANAASTQPSG